MDQDQDRIGDDAADSTTDTGVDRTTNVDEGASQEVMSLLSEHVPLALLADLVLPDGPDSPDILTQEGLPEVAWWEPEEGAEGTAGAPEGAAPSV